MNFYLKSSYHVAIPKAFHDDEELNVKAMLDHIVYLQSFGQSLILDPPI
ncbi:hypothetical protein [Enterococcus ureilyticus]|nr:hypothetical protein [Enterococcus ureilyticus]MBM7690001.1 hypothetical protein [Enterococcus ureilyticus]